MTSSIEIIKIYPDSFRANVYSVNPFRMIGLIDVGVIYNKSMERVTLAYFRSSGTNNRKIKGLWYPIVGIKIKDGKFTEFTPYINYVLYNTTKHGSADKGWLAKSLFFGNRRTYNNSKVSGFSSSRHYRSLYWIGKQLRQLYESGDYNKMKSLNPESLNRIVMSNKIYSGNKRTQIKNFEDIIEDIFKQQYK